MVDTRNRRASVLAFALGMGRVFPHPDGGLVDQADRQQIALSYPGIFVAGAIVVLEFAPLMAGPSAPNVSRHLFVLCDRFGNWNEILDSFESAEYTLNENEISVLNMTLPESAYSTNVFYKEALVYIFRAYRGGKWRVEGQTAFIVRNLEFSETDGAERIWLEAESMNSLLRDAVIPYQEGNEFTLKLDAADDTAKAVVRENRGSLATDTRRNVSRLSVVNDLGAAPVLLKGEISKKNALDVVRELVEESDNAGTWLGFNVAVEDVQAGTFRFETYTTTSDIDRRASSGNGILLGNVYGNLRNPKLRIESVDERNVVYAFGGGEPGLQAVAEVEDTASSLAGPFSRREKIVNASGALDGAAELTGQAESELRASRERVTVEGEIVETEQALYGRDYRLGTLVTVTQRRRGYDCRLSQVRVSLGANGEGETIAVTARSV